MSEKCKICGNDALKSQRSGLCSKHRAQYSRQRDTDGRSLSEFIKFMTMDIGEDATGFDEINIENAPEQKTLWQAKKEQEHTLRLSRENRVRANELVDKAEANRASGMVIGAILKDLESLTDIFPPILEHKSAGEIRPLLVRQFDSTFAQIRERLDELQKRAD